LKVLLGEDYQDSQAGAVGKWAGATMPRQGSAPSGVSRPAIAGSRLPPVDWGADKAPLPPNNLVASVSCGPSPDVLRKEAMGLKGKTKGLVRLRGFGFIRAENGEDVFFNCSALRGEDFDAL